MAKVIWIDDVPHRKRRGKLVPIPPEWFGKTVSKLQIRRRYSKNSIKKIDTRQERAKEQAVMARGEEPNPERPRKHTRWYYASGRTDQNRDKFRRERKASHPIQETDENMGS